MGVLASVESFGASTLADIDLCQKDERRQGYAAKKGASSS
jgi:hypothetical protein